MLVTQQWAKPFMERIHMHCVRLLSAEVSVIFVSTKSAFYFNLFYSNQQLSNNKVQYILTV